MQKWGISKLRKNLISVRLTDDELNKLNEIFDHFGIEGNDRSDKFRELLNKIHEKITHVDFVTSDKIMGENDDDDFGLPELPCPYASWHDKKKLLVDCGKDFSKKGKLYTIPFEACKQCYLRKLHIRQKKREKQSILPQTYYCTLKDETHRLNSPADLQKLSLIHIWRCRRRG